MYNTASNFRVSWLRNRGGAWLLLIVFLSSFLPATSFAQPPTAFIASVSGTVLVNGQARGRGTVLSAGDLLETQAGASVVLELSDGSTIELGEHTKLDIAVLAQTATGARTSQVKLWWGRVRATLSAQHQQVGSNFDIETPNALVGVKFSQPDVEVIYDPATQETTAFAYTVALWVTNLFTGEFRLVPVGSTVIITAVGIQVIAGITATGAAVGTAAAGMSTGTMIAIGAGAVAAGGVAVVAASAGDENGGKNGGKNGGENGGDGDGGDGDGGNPFTGTFTRVLSGPTDDPHCVPPESTIRLSEVVNLTQNGTVVTGTSSATLTFGNCCTATSTSGTVTATVVDETTAIITGPLSESYFYCEGPNCRCEDIFGLPSGVPTLRLVDNGRILRLEFNGNIAAEFYRQ